MFREGGEGGSELRRPVSGNGPHPGYPLSDVDAGAASIAEAEKRGIPADGAKRRCSATAI